MVYIILLNWNGWKDTVPCIESIINSSYQKIRVVVVDNDSNDDSVERIEEFISAQKIQDKVLIIKNNENSGFSKGCNIGIDYALKQSDCEYVWLLNNDTVVENDTISNLVSFFESHPKYSVLTPQINYFDNKALVWNCGGKISRLGFRKYFFAKENELVIPSKEYLNITFLTNCASFFRKDFFEDYRLDERFFFGEEDFSLSLYALKHHLKLACVLSAKIYHKVSSSIQKQTSKDENRHFVYYLNRMIDMKLYYNHSLIFRIYVKFYSFYIERLLRNNVSDLAQFEADLKNSVFSYNSVSKDMFESIIKTGYHNFTINYR